MKSKVVGMNYFNIFVILSIVAVASIITGVAMVTPSFAQENMSMPMDNSSMPMDQIVDMTMGMDNSTDMGGNSR
jgi:hypothetical protein